MTISPTFVPDRRPHASFGPFGGGQHYQNNPYGVDARYLQDAAGWFAGYDDYVKERMDRGVTRFWFDRPVGNLQHAQVPSVLCAVPELKAQTDQLCLAVERWSSWGNTVGTFIAARIGDGVIDHLEADEAAERRAFDVNRDDHCEHWYRNIKPLVDAGLREIGLDCANMDVPRTIEAWDAARMFGVRLTGESVAVVPLSNGTTKPHAATRRMPWATDSVTYRRHVDPGFLWKLDPSRTEVGLEAHGYDRRTRENLDGWTLEVLRQRSDQGVIVHIGGGLTPDEESAIVAMAHPPATNDPAVVS